MCDANVNAELKQLLAVCSKFVSREIVPHALEADQKSDAEFIRASLKKLTEVGVPDIVVPEEFGGTGLGFLAAALALDVISHGCASVATALAYHCAAQTALLEGGSEDQKRRWLETIVGAGRDSNVVGTCIFPSYYPASADDSEGFALEKKGNNLILNGKADLVPGAGLASFFTIFVRPRGDLLAGPLTALVIAVGREGVEIGEKEAFGGLKALPINPVTFHEVQVASDDILGDVEKANSLLERTRHTLHTFLGAAAVGLGRNAYEKALAYACERYQYGKIIARHQEIQRMLGKMLTSLYAGTSLYIHSLSGEKLNGLCTSPSGDYAKIFCTNASLEIAIDAVQIHGGYGYMQDYGVEKLMRDAKILQLLDCQNPVLQIESARREVQRIERSEKLII